MKRDLDDAGDVGDDDDEPIVVARYVENRSAGNLVGRAVFGLDVGEMPPARCFYLTPPLRKLPAAGPMSARRLWRSKQASATCKPTMTII